MLFLFFLVMVRAWAAQGGAPANATSVVATHPKAGVTFGIRPCGEVLRGESGPASVGVVGAPIPPSPPPVTNRETHATGAAKPAPGWEGRGRRGREERGAGVSIK